MNEKSTSSPASVPSDVIAKRFTLSRQALTAFCRKNHITRFSLFGSILREDFRPESDIDALVEFDPDHVPGFLRLGGMSAELSERLGNRFVDIKTPHALSRHFRRDVVETAVPLYASEQ